MKINLLLLDDNKILLNGMSMLLAEQAFVKEIFMATNWEKAQEILNSERIDVAMIDLELNTNKTDGFHVTEWIKTHLPDVKVIVFTNHLKEDYVHELCGQYGAEGFLSKHADVESLIEAIETVAKGEKYMDREIRSILAMGKRVNISKREQEVLKLLAKGKIKKEIASDLFLSVHTIEGHVANLKVKFEVSNTPELIAKYVQYKNSNHESDDKTSPFHTL